MFSTSPTTGKLTHKWIPVSDVTSLTMEREEEKRKSAKKRAQRENKKKAHRKNICNLMTTRGPYSNIVRVRPILLF